MKRFVLAHDIARANCLDFIRQAPKGWEVRISEPKRNLDQNARMWAMLGEVSAQVIWHGVKLTPESWKHMFSASLFKQTTVPGIDGGFVVMGTATSEMTRRQMAELIELIFAFGAEHGVEFHESEPA